MTTLVLATIAAVCYGLSDFLGGLGGRRTSAWAVAVVGQATSAVVAVCLALVIPGDPTPEALLWGALGGLGGGAGAAFLYRGLAAGSMGVVAPISAVGAALLPVVVGLLSGTSLTTLVWVGVALALPGIALAASEPGSPGPKTARRVPPGIADGLLAGLGFGLLFVALAQAESDAVGLWPIAAAQPMSALAALLLAVGLRESWRPDRVALRFGLAAGPLGAFAVALFLVAAQQGEFVIAAVLASLYPAATVVLAAVVLGERLHRVQVAGLALCAGAVTLIALG